MRKLLKLAFIALLSTLLIACGTKDTTKEKSKADKNGPKPTLVTVTQVKNQAIEITEEAVGSLEGLTNPTISAEVAARVIKIHVNTGRCV